MIRLKNYVLATAGLVILGGAVQLVKPLQAKPPDETMVITIAEDVTQVELIEFDAVDCEWISVCVVSRKDRWVGPAVGICVWREAELTH